MLLYSFSRHPPTPAARRRFRIVVGLIALVVACVLALQYTAYHALPARKTATLWGILVGMAAMTAIAEYVWIVARNREPAR